MQNKKESESEWDNDSIDRIIHSSRGQHQMRYKICLYRLVLIWWRRNSFILYTPNLPLTWLVLINQFDLVSIKKHFQYSFHWSSFLNFWLFFFYSTRSCLLMFSDFFSLVSSWWCYVLCMCFLIFLFCSIFHCVFVITYVNCDRFTIWIVYTSE